jgi:hypothetical protein
MSAVVIAEGQEPSSTASTARDLLLRHPGCAYTAALVTRSGQLLDWELHCQRLARWALGCLLCQESPIGRPPRR